MLGNGKYIDWFTSWFKGLYMIPSLRTVSYTGFPNESCQGCNNLTLRENVLMPVTGDVNIEVPLVFIAANEDEVPLLAIKLREDGKVKILQEEGRKFLPGSSIFFYIFDSLLIQMRTGEAVNTDGSLLFVGPNATFKAEDSQDVVMTKAKSLLTNASTPVFEQKGIHPMPVDRSIPYSNGEAFPLVGYRMLAAAKMFTIIEHFYPGKKTMGKDWETAYKAAIPKFISAKDSLEYWKAVAEFHAHIKDSHGFVSKSNEWFSLRLNPLIHGRGAFNPPVFTTMVENKIIISGVFNDSVCRKIGIGKGDIILSIDGKDPLQMIEQARRYQNAGNIGSQNFYLR